MYFSETDNEILLSSKFSADFRPKLISWITFHLLETFTKQPKLNTNYTFLFW